ncbi:AfsR/SARP family transcriptional regulator [Actinoplanes sp. CA-015351]|uniref:AfsR/SARP family transcriptional regulator n=1 Tax=Actinoplanes sp. CA-015351 TaxID=3239897 RepID=UPI003D967C61
MTLSFSLLGPVRAWRHGAEVPLGSPQQRTTLAVLLLREGLLTTIDELVDAIWPVDPPDSAVATIRTYLSRLRRLLCGPARVPGGPPAVVEVRIDWIGGGYVLTAPPGSLDVHLFHRHCARGAEAISRGDHTTAATELRSALDLHRGTPLAGAAGGYVEGQRARLTELSRGAALDLVAVTVELGRHAEAIAELRALVTEEPLRERGHALLMTALYRSGRQADALAQYRHLHRYLADELGVEPTPGLQNLHQSILLGDPDAGRTAALFPASTH